MTLIQPSDETAGAPHAINRGEAEYDALAELFLGDGPHAAPADPRGPLRLHTGDLDEDDRLAPERNPAAIEALVLGHLPVLAGPWVALYARFVADQRQERVALLRMMTDQASIDVFEPAPRTRSNVVVTLDEAIAAADRDADRWILRVDPPSEPLLSACPDVDAVTLLCGADDMAVVSAYRTIKSLLADLETSPLGAEPDAPSTPRFRVVIMGARRDRAEEACEKLRKAVGAFLEAPIETIVGPAQVSPSVGVTLFRGVGLRSPVELARQIRTLRAAPASVASAPAITFAIDPASHEPTQTACGQHVDEVASPAASVSAAGRGLVFADEPAALASRLPGLTPIDTACPYDGSVELAVDASGDLHLLAMHSPIACRAMSVVASWAHDHDALLTRLHPALRAGGAANPTMHLFTDRPNEARRLLDTAYRVHLLAPVVIEGKTAWCCLPLNADAGVGAS